MRRNELAQEAQPDAVVRRVGELAPQLPRHGHGEGHGHGAGQGHTTAMETTRKATYDGHDIVIRTTYQIEVDGMPIHGHLGVTNDGQVHYHAVPNLGFASAIDLVKQLIDTFPDDFETPAATHSHGGRS